jgi:hypothetical protein
MPFASSNPPRLSLPKNPFLASRRSAARHSRHSRHARHLARRWLRDMPLIGPSRDACHSGPDQFLIFLLLRLSHSFQMFDHSNALYAPCFKSRLTPLPSLLSLVFSLLSKILTINTKFALEASILAKSAIHSAYFPSNTTDSSRCILRQQSSPRSCSPLRPLG